MTFEVTGISNHCWFYTSTNTFLGRSFFLLVSHLRLSQRKNDPVVGWLNRFVVITLYQQQPFGSTYIITFLHFQQIRWVKTCNLSHKFQASLICLKQSLDKVNSQTETIIRGRVTYWAAKIRTWYLQIQMCQLDWCSRPLDHLDFHRSI